jgi:hypothetical protein
LVLSRPQKEGSEDGRQRDEEGRARFKFAVLKTWKARLAKMQKCSDEPGGDQRRSEEPAADRTELHPDGPAVRARSACHVEMHTLQFGSSCS